MPRALVAEIHRRLDAARVPGSRSKITANELREWAVEYLQDHDKELAERPDLIGLPHWNLWMMDTDLESALFAVLVFWPEGVDLICGTGNSFDIRGWDSADPANPATLLAELRRDFVVPEDELRMKRRAAKAWLGRGW